MITLFLLVILIRTLLFRPKAQPPVDTAPVEFDREGSVEALRRLVRCRTVSCNDPAREDEEEFEKLHALLPTLYPRVFAACQVHRLPHRALLIRWPGAGEGDPAVLMAHYDVVPAGEEGWEKPPFEGILEDGVLWGRGTLDTKVTFSGILCAANALLERGFTPRRDVYFAFSGGEEVAGPGAGVIVDWFRERGLTPAFVLDEGGAVVEKVFPGVSAPCGLIGIAEKGMINARFTARSQGGHASAPKPHTPVGILAQACCRIENRPFPAHVEGPARQMFDTLGRHSGFGYRLLFANLWCFSWVLDLLAKKQGGEMNALLRTTVAFTQMQGSPARNVIPPEAAMVANLRLNPRDTVASALARLQKLAGDRVTVTALEGNDPSRVSRTDCPGWETVASAVASTWPGCLVAPYLMVQCSDSRHWGALSDRVYRFSAMALSAQERATIHGNNERIPVPTVHRAVEFFIRLLKQC